MGGGGPRRAPYHVVVRLLWWAATVWDELDAMLIMRGVDWWGLPLDRALNVLWYLLMQNRGESERAALAFRLDQPLPHQVERGKDDFWAGHEEDGAAWERAAGQLAGLMG